MPPVNNTMAPGALKPGMNPQQLNPQQGGLAAGSGFNPNYPKAPGNTGPMNQGPGAGPGMMTTGRGNLAPGGPGVGVSANSNLNNSIMDNSNMNLLDQSRNNGSQMPMYDYGKNFNNSSFRA